MLRTLFLLAALCAGCLAAGDAAARNRHAFVVGNQAYGDHSNLSSLTKAVADATLYARVLTDLGYDLYGYDPRIPGDAALATTDLNREQFFREFGLFLEKVRRNDVVVFIFSGHGIATKAGNHLLPIGFADLNNATALQANSINLARVSRDIAQRNPAEIVMFIDACHDDPRNLGADDAERGPAMVNFAFEDITFGGYFSSNPGQVSFENLGPDDADPNSVFTRFFAPKLAEGGPVYDAFAHAYEKMLQAYKDGLLPAPQTPANLATLPAHYSLAPPRVLADVAPAWARSPDACVDDPSLLRRALDARRDGASLGDDAAKALRQCIGKAAMRHIGLDRLAFSSDQEVKLSVVRAGLRSQFRRADRISQTTALIAVPGARPKRKRFPIQSESDLLQALGLYAFDPAVRWTFHVHRDARSAYLDPTILLQ